VTAEITGEIPHVDGGQSPPGRLYPARRNRCVVAPNGSPLA
jgi:hypothetical protein